ncbi:MAG: glycosyl hydrolase 53 family protein [Bacilli bacterium]|nr:glycosyl hydrolase 53 family protein [Bacilli bacterium]
MRLGIDTSTMIEEEAAGIKYFDNGKEVDPFLLFRNNNVDLMRIRIWNNPYSEDGKPYLGGTNDMDQAIKIIRKTKRYGFSYCINFHYSDFWVDPMKQRLPKAWENYSLEELKEAVYDYTKSSLERIKKEDIRVDYIQIGNEITNGMLWPYGKLVYDEKSKTRSNYENFVAFLNRGIKAAREIYPDSKIIIHLESPHEFYKYEEVLSNLEKYKVDYDVLGTSYYPYWHGTMDDLFKSIKVINDKYHKPVMICELGYGFTLKDYMLNNNGFNQMKVNPDTLTTGMPYPMTPRGQADFVEDFVNRCKVNDVEGVMYWEPLWRQGEGICWASREGQKYINEEGKSTRNEWANQCFFDYDGNKLPVFDKYKI